MTNRLLPIPSRQNEQIVPKLFETMSWSHFVDEYGPPFRVSTLFDELVKSVSDKPPRVSASQDQVRDKPPRMSASQDLAFFGVFK